MHWPPIELHERGWRRGVLLRVCTFRAGERKTHLREKVFVIEKVLLASFGMRRGGNRSPVLALELRSCARQRLRNAGEHAGGGGKWLLWPDCHRRRRRGF